jgi:hypothetical protein
VVVGSGNEVHFSTFAKQKIETEAWRIIERYGMMVTFPKIATHQFTNS